MIWNLVGFLVFGKHEDPSFYSRLARRTPPTAGEPVSELLRRTRVNLERDYLVRLVATRMVLVIIAVVWVADAMSLRPVSVEQATAEAREQIQERQREVEALREQVRSRHFRAVPGGAP